MQHEFNVIFGKDWMAIYRDGKLVVEGLQLCFGDVLEAIRMPVTMQSADMEWSEKVIQAKGGFPPNLADVVMEGEGETA